MRGTVTDDRVPVVELFLDGREWRAVIDTGSMGIWSCRRACAVP